jgi:hypothetical protein
LRGQDLNLRPSGYEPLQGSTEAKNKPFAEDSESDERAPEGSVSGGAAPGSKENSVGAVVVGEVEEECVGQYATLPQLDALRRAIARALGAGALDDAASLLGLLRRLSQGEQAP